MLGLTARPTLPKPNAFSLLVLLVLGYMYFCPPADLDYCWQIRTGERILASGKLQQPDTFSYTINGREIPDHEWLYEILIAFLWRGLGDAGMKLVRVTLFAAPLAILAWQLTARGVRKHGVALTLLVCTLILFYFERLRPLVISTIGIQLVSGWLHDHCRGRRKLDWKLPLTMLLWGNLHPAVIMGQALLVGAIGWEWFAYWRNRPAADVRIPRGLTLWGGLGLLASLVAPDPVGRLMYPFAPELRHPAQRLFTEIKPPLDFLGKAPHVIDFVLLIAIFFGIVLALRWRALRGWEWGLLLGLGGLALTATRATGDWLMVTAALAVPQIGPLLRRLSSMRRSHFLAGLTLKADRVLRKIFQGPFLQPQSAWPALLYAALAIFTVLPIRISLPNREAAHWPTAAVTWIENGGLPTKGPWNIFSGSDEGTYLLWRLPEQAHVYSDTRGFYYPGDLLMDSYYLPDADAQWPKRLERVLGHGTQYFLVRSESKFWKILEPYAAAAPIYRDDMFVILTAASVNSAAAKAIASEKNRAAGLAQTTN
jgi:hypothetical protein